MQKETEKKEDVKEKVVNARKMSLEEYNIEGEKRLRGEPNEECGCHWHTEGSTCLIWQASHRTIELGRFWEREPTVWIEISRNENSVHFQISGEEVISHREGKYSWRDVEFEVDLEKAMVSTLNRKRHPEESPKES